jgi:hypothetical protein
VTICQNFRSFFDARFGRIASDYRGIERADGYAGSQVGFHCRLG